MDLYCESHPFILFPVFSTSAGCRYILLTVVQTLYAYFVEGNTVFEGKRKSLSKRVSNDTLSLACHSLFLNLTL